MSEMSEFLDGNYSLDISERVVLSHYKTFHDAWKYCDNAYPILELAVCKEVLGNYNTCLLIFSGNIVNFLESCVSEIKVKVKSMFRELSSMHVRALFGQRIYLMSLDKFLIDAKMIFYDRLLISKMSVLADRLCKGLYISTATAAIELFNIVKENFRLTSLKFAGFSPADELRKLIGNPFDEID